MTTLRAPQMALPFGAQRPSIVLACGAGQDSVTLLYLLDNEDFRKRYIKDAEVLVVFADTGDEHPDTYVYLEQNIRPFCATRGIDFRWITPELGYHTPAWPNLRHQYEKNSCCGFKEGANGSCSDSLKIAVTWRLVNDWLAERYGFSKERKGALKTYASIFGPLRCIIGFAAGEERRIRTKPTGKPWFDDNVVRIFPLIDLGLDRMGCQALIQAMGHPVPPPSHCVMCHWKSKLEIMWTRRHLPERFETWAAIEQAKLAKFAYLGPSRNKTVFGQGKTLHEVADEAESEYAEWSDAQIEEHRMSHGHCVSSVY